MFSFDNAVETIPEAVLTVGVGPMESAGTKPADRARISTSLVLDTWNNLHGGLATGVAHANDVGIRLDLDGERLVAWPGGSASVSALHDFGSGPSAAMLGDLQVADNIEAPNQSRIYEAWVQQTAPGIRIKLGKIDLNTEFNVNNTATLFINGAQALGVELGQVGFEGPSVFPDPRGGVVVDLQWPWNLKAGLFEGRPVGATGSAASRLDAKRGYFGIVESANYLGDRTQLKFGVWRHTAAFGSSLGAVRAHSASGGYILLEQAVSAGAISGDAFLRVGVADPKTHQIANSLSSGFVFRHPFTDSDSELLGIGVTVALNGEHYMSAQQHEAPLRHETALELTYRRMLTSRIAIQPDVQYIIHPGAARGVSNALLIGVRLSYSWDHGW